MDIIYTWLKGEWYLAKKQKANGTDATQFVAPYQDIQLTTNATFSVETLFHM